MIAPLLEFPPLREGNSRRGSSVQALIIPTALPKFVNAQDSNPPHPDPLPP